MKVRAVIACTVNMADGSPLKFEAGEVKDLKPGDAAAAVFTGGWSSRSRCFKILLEGNCIPWPGCLVTWLTEDGVQGPAYILISFHKDGEEWLVLMDWGRQKGHLIRRSEILEFWPNNILAALVMVLNDSSDDRRRDAAMYVLSDILGAVNEST